MNFLLMIFIIKMGMFISLILKVYGQSLTVFLKEIMIIYNFLVLVY